ncbi:hypothetical protein F5B20DRAFT_584262 [Whalleya microplaca]|nr:hypothetical protein F5B20DRAFT_584262 [Whalleya microplaca]
MASLVLLPAELIRLVFIEFVPDALEVNAPVSDIVKHKQNRATLRAAILTCRYFRDEVTPLLYRHTLVTTGIQCARLCGTLLAQPALRPEIKTFSSLVNLISSREYAVAADHFKHNVVYPTTEAPLLPEALDHDTSQIISRAGITFDKTSDLIQKLMVKRDENDGSPNPFLQRAVGLILILSPKLENVLLRYPPDDSPPIYWDLSEMGNMLQNYESSGKPFLVSVQTLRFEDYPLVRKTALPSGATSTVDDDAMLPLLRLPNLKRTDMHRPVVRWIQSYLDAPNHQAPGLLTEITDLRVTGMEKTSVYIYDLLRRCKKLSRLVWTFQQSPLWENTIDDVLAPAKETLRDLHLESLPRDPYAFTRPNDGNGWNDMFAFFEHLQEAHVFRQVTCLATFKHLQSLKIDLMTLLGPRYRDRLFRFDLDLVSLLPPNLKRLELIEVSLNDIFKDNYHVAAHDEWFCRYLLWFASSCSSRMPHLQKFIFHARRPVPKNIGVNTRLRHVSFIRLLAMRFHEAGIELNWVWQDKLALGIYYPKRVLSGTA